MTRRLFSWVRRLVLVAAVAIAAAVEPTLRPSYDLVVYGSTPGGIACAVRAAREGLQVLLVTHSEHVGGILSNGLSTMDTLYSGARAPLYDEFRQSIYDHYRTVYGENSPQYKASLPGHPKTKFEAHVVERIFEVMLKKNGVSRSCAATTRWSRKEPCALFTSRRHSRRAMPRRSSRRSPVSPRRGSVARPGKIPMSGSGSRVMTARVGRCRSR